MHKILVVDDEPLLMKMLFLSLQTEGYKVVGAIDGEEAIRQIQETQPDLVLLDIRLPKVNGFEVIRSIRSGDQSSKIPVIFMTADASINLPASVKKFQASGYLLKPYSWNEMLEKIKSCLN